ncbi:MAG TPA: ATP-binding protein [Cyanobacteria bacterium UBA11369]|nr:ATP-binding protein [Cyanobacteria bacterium UBA11371]HBE17877.1 ATP-binding protein [Cyanobacteria bacterium UBA11367]HBE34651.1 ATP-binding protein [Cyanobacteria bacterium UBA11368]HBE49148.1 ATP-binding protein [Cyanobacteria bacterium UBA11369]
MTQYISISSTRNRKFYGVVRSDSIGNELLGKLGFIRFKAGHKQEITVLCQITSVDRRNIIHEDPSFGPVISNKGSIPYLSGIGDYEESVAKPIAQQVDGKPAALRANPPSGTHIVSLDDESVSQSVNSQKVFNSFSSTESQFLRYGGTLVGESIKVPFICKSFDPKSKNGWGEARHAGFFGRSGSGKTHAAKIMLALSLVSMPRMGAFVPDAKGDFVKPSQQDLDLKKFFIDNGRSVEIVSIKELKLDQVDHFRELLIIEDVQKLMINAAADKFRTILDIALSDFSDDDDKLIVSGDKAITLERLLESFNSRIELYYSGSDRDLQKRLDQARNVQDSNKSKLNARFQKVLKTFREGQDINELIAKVLQEGKIYFLDAHGYDEDMNRFILELIYKRFRRRASNLFYEGKYSNAIVYVDEANRFIPQSPTEDQKELAKELIDGIKTTRQYGLAWWFADQRPAAISKDAFTQLGTYFFGKGMTAAADRENMESVIGKEGVQIYEYVMTASSRPFIASGQFIGIGGEDSVTVPIEFFGNWKDMIDFNNQDFDAHLSSS